MLFALNVTMHCDPGSPTARSFLPTSDRLIDAMTIQVTSDGHGVETLTEVRQFQRRILVHWMSSGDEFTLNIAIPSVLSISQKFKAVEGSSGDVSISALTPPVHPRLFVAAVASGSGEVVVQLDLTFLDVSARKWNRLPHEQYAGLTSAAFEMVGQRPRVWMLLIPSSISSSETEAEILLFLRPEVRVPYQDGDEITPYGFFTVFADQPPSPNPIASYLRFDPSIGPGRFYTPFHACSWGLQLFQSRRKAILVFPVPHTDQKGVAGMDYGVLLDPNNLANTLKLLLRALVQENKLSAASGSTTPTIKRLALGGFSLAGDLSLKVWQQNQSLIHELYLFDPGQGIPTSDALVSWLKVDSDRRLELVCPAFSRQAAVQLEAKLPARINARATSSTYFSRDAAYLSALDSEFTTTAPGGSSGRATVRSNIFLENETPAPNQEITLRGTGTKDLRSVRQTIAGVTASEAAVFVEGKLAPRLMPLPLDTTKQDVAKVLAGITVNEPGQQQPRQLDHHHSWAIQGGEMHPGRTGPEFHGFLQVFLEESRFTAAP
jgi:hypothetical protein